MKCKSYGIFQNYELGSAKSIQDAVKDAFAPLFERVLNAEMTAHLGYDKSDQSPKTTVDRRNGYSEKTIKTTAGETTIKVPRDRDGTFEPVIVSKHQRDVSGIEDKVLAMYARGMSQRDIAQTIEDIYGFKISYEKISTITDLIVKDVKEWQARELKAMYAFVYVDCLYASIRDEHSSRATMKAIYVILGIDLDGCKEILGLWVSPSEAKSTWMNIFDSIKQRGVQDILFLCMDGVSGLEDGVKAAFPETVVQRCLVHLMRNSLKYVPSKDYKAFCASIKAVYEATSLEECRDNFKVFKEQWEKKHPGAVKVWEKHFQHVEQLFDYPQDIRRVMYTTNLIESVNSSLRKVTKQGSFDSKDAVFKALFLRIKELERKWDGQKVRNWAKVLNQLIQFDDLQARISRYHNI